MKKIVFVLLILVSFTGCNKIPKDLQLFLEDRFWDVSYWAERTEFPLFCAPKSFEELPKDNRLQLFLLKSNGELWLYAGEKNEDVGLVQSCHIGSWSAMVDELSLTFTNGESRQLKIREIERSKGWVCISFDNFTSFFSNSFNHEVIEDTEIKKGRLGSELETFEKLKKGTLIRINYKYNTLIDGWWRLSYKKKSLYIQDEHLVYYGEKGLKRKSETVEEAQEPAFFDKIGTVMFNFGNKMSGFFNNALRTWGFWRGVMYFLVIPFLLIYILVRIPANLLAKARKVPNWLFVILIFSYAFAVLIVIGQWYADSFLPRFDHELVNDFAPFIVAIVFILFAYQMIKLKWDCRCTKCRSLYNTIVSEQEETNTTKTTTTTTWSDGSKDKKESYETSTTFHYLRKCDECGYQWWTSFFLPF